MPASSAASAAEPVRLAPFVASTALGSTAYIAAFTAASLAAREITGRAELSGLPSALGTIGTAVAVGLLSATMSRHGRRPGLLAGYAVAVLGAAASVAAIALGWFPLLLAGSIAVGFGNAGVQLSRYAAADHVAPERRAAVVGTVVWGSTAGAVLGPNLIAPAGSLAGVLGRPALEGGMSVTVIGFAIAMLVTLAWVRRSSGPGGPEPGGSLERTGRAAPVGVASRTSAPAAPGLPGGRLAALAPLRVRLALMALVTGQVVMVLIMTMTPVHIRDMGGSLATVGFVISAHTLGMFALSPVSGRLVARFGSFPVLVVGFGTLFVAALLSATARDTDVPLLTLGLFLLGYGWNLAFIAGSSLLTGGTSQRERIRLQGLTDMLVWTAGAAASFSSGLLLDWAGYQTLAVVGGALLVLPSAAILVARRRIPLAMQIGA